MKKIIYILSLLFLTFVNTYSQCAFNNTLLSTITPTCPGVTTIPCINGGQYVSVNVTSGNSYVFSTCGGSTWDTQITLYNAAGTTVLGYSDDACGLQSSVAWTATYTGVANVLVDQYPCSSNATCATLTISCSTTSGSGCIGGSNNTCGTADPFCTGINYNYCNTTGVSSMGTYDCLFTTPNPMWMYLNVTTNGNIDIQIQQFNNSNVGIDVDFALYGPYTSVTAGCSVINGSTVPVDCSYSAAFTETANIVGAVAGQWYILLITNYSNQAGYIQFSQTGGSGVTNCGILPIELFSFNGHNDINNGNIIQWSTITETNNDHFVLERSVDGQNYKEVTIINGAGTSTHNIKYSFVDKFYTNGELNYYRLKQVDKDKNFKYSNTIVINNIINKVLVVTEYYDIFGNKLTSIPSGVQLYIVVYKYNDGSTKVVKQFN